MESGEEERSVGPVSGDCVNGEGEYEYGGGNSYSGQWVGKRRHGEGCYKYARGGQYDG